MSDQTFKPGDKVVVSWPEADNGNELYTVSFRVVEVRKDEMVLDGLDEILVERPRENDPLGRERGEFWFEVNDSLTPLRVKKVEEEVEIAYRIPGKGGFRRKTFQSEAQAERFVDTLTEKEGDDVEIRWRD
jgi:hypothetical protein